MKSVRIYLVTGVIAYLLILVSTFPVTRLVSGVEAQVAGLALQSVEGSLFSGSVRQVYLSGKDLGAVQWSLRPLPLLQGRLEYRLGIDHPDYHGDARLGIAITGRLYVKDLDLQLAPSQVMNRFLPVAVSASGEAHLLVDELEPGDPLPELLSGRLVWNGAALDSPLQLALGDLALDLARTAAGIEAQVARGGVLGASGKLVLGPGGNYQIDLVLRPPAGLAADLDVLLENAGRRLPGGGYRIRSAGKLPVP